VGDNTKLVESRSMLSNPTQLLCPEIYPSALWEEGWPQQCSAVQCSAVQCSAVQCSGERMAEVHFTDDPSVAVHCIGPGQCPYSAGQGINGTKYAQVDGMGSPPQSHETLPMLWAIGSSHETSHKQL
jgi:hypothetical protein